ncbi:adaptor protein MecA [Aquibacillus salsiterrae]|uniref:Adapter protein MecA n=1 Tax=Aquibacillus salsiterrae TaxID=2950439 RepID=A0A9X3WCD1_9BACI|nr:adaptor protein MecA [Aquibacillus salsiterrae]MDC3417200.1 adaptor protein MecA [Aquibacillus salsiterrae]
MEIERINENTVKFYISYLDIEDRGFDREEIWYNREKSEQLFWQVMDEVNYNEEDFNIDGPLWIQVQALDKGLEIVVTKAQISKDGQNLELTTENGKTIDMPVDEKIESLLEEKFGSHMDVEEEIHALDELSFILAFPDFEDVIQLSHHFTTVDGLEESLYHFENQYLLLLQFDDEKLSDDEQEDILSQVLEFGLESSVTIHRLQEYGKPIFETNALANIKQYFIIK